jgi:hypothetical protein
MKFVFVLFIESGLCVNCSVSFFLAVLSAGCIYLADVLNQSGNFMDKFVLKYFWSEMFNEVQGIDGLHLSTCVAGARGSIVR